MKIRNRKALAALGAVSMLTAGVAIPAIAQDETSTEAPTAAEDRIAEREAAREAHKEAFAARLAEELGLDADTVADALATVHEEFRSEREAGMLERLQERLAQAVEDERLTQEEADDILERAENGEFPARHGRRHRPGAFLRGPLLDGADAEPTSAGQNA